MYTHCVDANRFLPWESRWPMDPMASYSCAAPWRPNWRSIPGSKTPINNQIIIHVLIKQSNYNMYIHNIYIHIYIYIIFDDICTVSLFFWLSYKSYKNPLNIMASMGCIFPHREDPLQKKDATVEVKNSSFFFPTCPNGLFFSTFFGTKHSPNMSKLQLQKPTEGLKR